MPQPPAEYIADKLEAASRLADEDRYNAALIYVHIAESLSRSTSTPLSLAQWALAKHITTYAARERVRVFESLTGTPQVPSAIARRSKLPTRDVRSILNHWTTHPVPGSSVHATAAGARARFFRTSTQEA